MPIDQDCGNANRTIYSACECKCIACKKWWCENIPGYFLCPACHRVELSVNQYDGMCEQCFDNEEFPDA